MGSLWEVETVSFSNRPCIDQANPFVGGTGTKIVVVSVWGMRHHAPAGYKKHAPEVFSVAFLVQAER